jgi:hypothetical protein
MSSARRGRGGAASALGALVLGGVVAIACGDSGSSSGTKSAPGNDVTNDTRDAEPRPPATPDPGDGSPGGQPDATYYGDATYASDAPASYPGIAECSSCSCPAASAYCFGGATPRPYPMITPLAADAGTPCPMVAAGTEGCTPLPAGSTDCASLITTLQPTYACYLVCAYNGKQMTVYCPNP